jgi:hypothetical protein
MKGMSQCTQTYVNHSSSFDIGSTITLRRAALATLPGHRSRREDGRHQYQRAADHKLPNRRDRLVDDAEPSKCPSMTTKLLWVLWVHLPK